MCQRYFVSTFNIIINQTNYIIPVNVTSCLICDYNFADNFVTLSQRVLLISNYLKPFKYDKFIQQLRTKKDIRIFRCHKIISRPPHLIVSENFIRKTRDTMIFRCPAKISRCVKRPDVKLHFVLHRFETLTRRVTRILRKIIQATTFVCALPFEMQRRQRKTMLLRVSSVGRYIR